MRPRDLVIDAGIAVGVLGVSLGVLAAQGLGAPGPGTADLDGAGVALAAATSLPLAARRLAPLPVYLVTAVATTVLVGLRYPLDFPFGAVVALYGLAVGHSRDPRRALRLAAQLAVAAFVPVVAAVYAGLGHWERPFETGVAFWALTVGVTWIAGDLTGLRRERIAELETLAARGAREAERERRLAVAEERTRIARELHDSAGHAINVVLVQAGAARLLHERDPAGSRQAISIIEQVARDTIVEIDRLVRVLREDDEAGLSGRAWPVDPADPAALDELVEQHRAGGLRVEADVCGHRRALPRAVGWAAHRILREALTNAWRHGCGSARVDVHYRPDAVEISVSNPTGPGAVAGHGGAGGHSAVGGHGIVGMRERATLLGGALSAGASDGVFRLHARLPYGQAGI